MFSQPMNGKTYKEIVDTKYDTAEKLENHIKKKMKVESFIIMDTIVTDRDKKSTLECFAESIGYMSQADLLVMCKGWQKSRGCTLEHEIAKTYDLPIMYYDDL